MSFIAYEWYVQINEFRFDSSQIRCGFSCTFGAPSTCSVSQYRTAIFFKASSHAVWRKTHFVKFVSTARTTWKLKICHFRNRFSDVIFLDHQQYWWVNLWLNNVKRLLTEKKKFHSKENENGMLQYCSFKCRDFENSSPYFKHFVSSFVKLQKCSIVVKKGWLNGFLRDFSLNWRPNFMKMSKIIRTNSRKIRKIKSRTFHYFAMFTNWISFFYFLSLCFSIGDWPFISIGGRTESRWTTQISLGGVEKIISYFEIWWNDSKEHNIPLIVQPTAIK